MPEFILPDAPELPEVDAAAPTLPDLSEHALPEVAMAEIVHPEADLPEFPFDL